MPSLTPSNVYLPLGGTVCFHNHETLGLEVWTECRALLWNLAGKAIFTLVTQALSLDPGGPGPQVPQPPPVPGPQV